MYFDPKNSSTWNSAQTEVDPNLLKQRATAQALMAAAPQPQQQEGSGLSSADMKRAMARWNGQVTPAPASSAGRAGAVTGRRS